MTFRDPEQERFIESVWAEVQRQFPAMLSAAKAGVDVSGVPDSRVQELVGEEPSDIDPMANLHRTFKGTKAFRPVAGVHGKELRKLRRAAQKELGL